MKEVILHVIVKSISDNVYGQKSNFSSIIKKALNVKR